MYNRPRIIPCLLIQEQGLVKTIKFSNPNYLGDVINAVKIFNEKEVDELCLLDITASSENRGPDFTLLKDIASEAFMPMSYGGGISDLDQAKKLFFIGYEKIILNTAFIENPSLIKEIVNYAGSQSVVVSIDAKKRALGNYNCYTNDGKMKIGKTPQELALLAEKLGAGEILLNSVDRDGTMTGYDINLIKSVTEKVSIPVIASGGASGVQDFRRALKEGKAHAVAAGSIFVYYGKKKAVLINVPDEQELIEGGVYDA